MPGKQMKNLFSCSLVTFLIILSLMQEQTIGDDLTSLGWEENYSASLQGNGTVAVVFSNCDKYDVSPAILRCYSPTWPGAVCIGDCNDCSIYPTYYTLFTIDFDPNVFVINDTSKISWSRISPGYSYISDGGLGYIDFGPFFRDFFVSLAINPEEITSADIDNTITISVDQECVVNKDGDCPGLDLSDFSGLYDSLGSITIEVDIEIGGKTISGSDGGGPGAPGGGGGPGIPGFGSGGDPGAPPGGGGECIGGMCTDTGGGLSGMSVGHTEPGLYSEMQKTLGSYSSVFEFKTSWYPEVLYDGIWIKPSQMSKWSTYGIQYVTSGNDVTKVWFDVKDPLGIKYEYSMEGNWTGADLRAAKIAACEDIESQKNMELKYVIDSVNDVTLKTYKYEEEVRDSVNYRNVKVNTGNGLVDNGGVVYQMKETPGQGYGLERIWAGKELALLPDLGVDPNSNEGRWVDIKTQYNLDSGISMITESGCGSCGGAKRSYEYVAGNTNQKASTPTHYLVSKVKAINSSQIETVLESYDYDSRDRKTSYWLGDKDDPGSGRLAVKIDEAGDMRTQKDYVDSTDYRATVYLYDNYDNIIEKRQYHDLQTGTELTGKFSRTMYKTETDSYGNLTKKITILPKGNTIVKQYGTSSYNKGRVIKRQRGSIVEAQYDYTKTAGATKLNSSTNAVGAVTNYSYQTVQPVSGVTLIASQTAAEPASGVFGSAERLTTTYKYDLSNRVTEQIVSGNTPTTYYFYDTFGNLTEERFDGVTTHYKYNQYNEQTLSYRTGPGHTDRRNDTETSYDNFGRVEERFSYKSSTLTSPNVVSGAAYFYDDYGRLATKKKVLGYDSAGQTLTWSSEVYEYDTYGRKIRSIVDPGGENLTTSYEYNNQSEVTRVTRPDLSSTATIRDGRGLVRQVINSKGANSSTTQYYYDLNGNLTKQQDPEGVCDFYRYDSFDRRTVHRRGK